MWDNQFNLGCDKLSWVSLIGTFNLGLGSEERFTMAIKNSFLVAWKSNYPKEPRVCLKTEGKTVPKKLRLPFLLSEY